MISHPHLRSILSNSYTKGPDGIYSDPMFLRVSSQDVERELRERVVASQKSNYLYTIALNHSIPVMDYEIVRFLLNIPQGGLILDIGGCWGWHWRNLQSFRPDLSVVIVDFVPGNLYHAQKLLGSVINKSVFLVHGDATALKFPDFVFNAVWTVQTFQHIPNYGRAVSEAFRVLMKRGKFANYSLNIQPHIAAIYRLIGKHYTTAGLMEAGYWLARASLEQKQQVESIFGCTVSERWSEIIYSPELRFASPGRERSLLGKFDALLSNNIGFLRSFARQHSFHIHKP